jgi:hypothetical protein
VVSKAVLVVTKDLGDQGVGLVVSHPLECKEVVVGFCHEEATSGEPWYFLGTQRTSVSIEGAFWLAGIELQEFMNENRSDQLEPLVPMAKMLVPCSIQEQAAASSC